MANSLSTDSEIPNGALYFQRFFDLLVSINKNYCNDIINKIHGLLELYASFLTDNLIQQLINMVHINNICIFIYL